MRAHIRMLFMTADEKGQTIPDKTKALLRYTALDQWQENDHRPFDSSMYPNYALAQQEEDVRAVAMGELLGQWASGMNVTEDERGDFENKESDDRSKHSSRSMSDATIF